MKDVMSFISIFTANCKSQLNELRLLLLNGTMEMDDNVYSNNNGNSLGYSQRKNDQSANDFNFQVTWNAFENRFNTLVIATTR